MRLVKTAEPQWPAGEGWRISPKAALVIGVDEGLEAEMFTYPSSASRLPDGRIIVPDNTGEIRYFSEDGQHLLTAGRSGPGPCEFGQIGEAYSASDGSVVAMDYSGMRAELFDASGGCLGSLSLQFDGFRYNADLVGRLANGDLIILSDTSEQFRTLDAEGWIRSTLLRLPTSGSGPISLVEVPFIEGRQERLRFASRGSATAKGDRIYYTTGESYEIHVYDPDGVLIQSMSRSEAPSAVTAAVIEAFVAKARANIRARGEQAVGDLSRLDNEKFAPSFPAYRRLKVADDGSVWAQRHDGLADTLPYVYDWRDASSLFEQPAVRTWDVYATDGAWLGPVTIPSNRWLNSVDSRTVLLGGEDELGIARVWVHELIKP